MRTDIDFFYCLREGLDELISGQREVLEPGYKPRMALEEFVACLDYVPFDEVKSCFPPGLLDEKCRLKVGAKVRRRRGGKGGKEGGAEPPKKHGEMEFVTVCFV